MDNQELAIELVRMAKELVRTGKAGDEKSFASAIASAQDAIKEANKASLWNITVAKRALASLQKEWKKEELPAKRAIIEKKVAKLEKDITGAAINSKSRDFSTAWTGV